MEFQRERGVFLSSFFYGYITTQILGGILAPLMGAARLACIGLFGTNILALMTPSVTYGGGLIPLTVIKIFKESSKVYIYNIYSFKLI